MRRLVAVLAIALTCFAGSAQAQFVSGCSSTYPCQAGEPAVWLNKFGDTGPAHNTFNLPAPTIAAGAGAGSTPSIAINGVDFSFGVTVTTGTTPAASSPVATITLGSLRQFAPHCLMSPANAAAAGLTGAAGVYLVVAGTTPFAPTITAGATALAASTSYAWTMICGP